MTVNPIYLLISFSFSSKEYANYRQIKKKPAASLASYIGNFRPLVHIVVVMTCV